MSANLAGALVGLAAAIGVLIVAGRLVATRRPTLAQRIAPFVPVAGGVRRAEPDAGALVALTAIVSSSWSRVGAAADGHRVEQLASAGVGAVAGLLLGVGAVVSGAHPLAPLLLATFGVLIGALVHDRLLARQRQRRSARIAEQLPVIAELLAFAVAAGEPVAVALARIAATTSGELADEVTVTVGEMRAGSSFDAAMRDLSVRCASPDVERFVDGLVVAMERGTPIVDVLCAQAADARAMQRRLLMEQAGRKDVAMLVPVVFLILPTVVVIALYPGLQALRVIVP